MKITKLTTYKVPPRWAFVKIETDEGITGWGEPVIEGRADTVLAAVAELAEYLVGKDPSCIEDHWNVMYRGGFYRGGPILMSAISGIDQALWDIKGKALDVPVYQLLGGKCRDKIRTYSWIGGDKPSNVAADAAKIVNKGFTALKLNGAEKLQIVDSYEIIDKIVETIATVRETVGSHVGIAVDFHGRVQRPMAKILVKELEQFRLMFIEEPVLSENHEALQEITKHTNTPIALGERLYSRWDFKPILNAGYVDILQPDLSHAGGITESRKIATMAEAYDVALAPHCPLGPIALASCLHIDAVSHNAFIQEQSGGMHYNRKNDLLDYVVNKSALTPKDGYLAIPEGPGLGIEIDEDYLKKQSKIGHNWHNPIWRHEDGSVAEW